MVYVLGAEETELCTEVVKDLRAGLAVPGSKCIKKSICPRPVWTAGYVLVFYSSRHSSRTEKGNYSEIKARYSLLLQINLEVLTIMCAGWTKDVFVCRGVGEIESRIKTSTR